MARRSGAWWMTLLVAGCQSNVRHEAPDLGGAKSALIIATDVAAQGGLKNAPELEGRRLTMVEALSLDDNGKLPVFFESNDVELYYLPWSCPLVHLGMSPGPQALLEKPVENAALPASLGIQVDPRGDPSWKKLEGDVPSVLDDALLRLPITGGTCERLAPEYEFKPMVAFDNRNTYPAFAIEANGAAVVGATDGQTLLIDASGAAAHIDIPDVGNWPIAAQLGADGEAWFLTGLGQIAKGPLTGPKRLYPGLAAMKANRSQVEMLVGFVVTKETDPIEAYLVTQDRSLQRYDGTAWTELSRGQPRAWTTVVRYGPSDIPVSLYFRPQLLRIGPTAIATYGVTDRDDVIVTVDGGSVSEMQVTSGAFVSRLHLHPSAGLLVADSQASMFTPDDEGWRSPVPLSRLPVSMVVDDELGMWRFDFGAFYSVQPDSGLCRQPGEFSVPLQAVAIAPDRWVLASVDVFSLALPDVDLKFPGGAPLATVRLMTRRRAAPRCSPPL